MCQLLVFSWVKAWKMPIFWKDFLGAASRKWKQRRCVKYSLNTKLPTFIFLFGRREREKIGFDRNRLKISFEKPSFLSLISPALCYPRYILDLALKMGENPGKNILPSFSQYFNGSATNFECHMYSKKFFCRSSNTQNDASSSLLMNTVYFERSSFLNFSTHFAFFWTCGGKDEEVFAQQNIGV